jgi:alkanesulfonate monooxygenase SsuD/methylene tetrahydromethanopterin reductase-like flavin-dependent oxidoreductase (luciferase family)
VIVVFKKMWETRDYRHHGPAFPTPGRDVVPKLFGGDRAHPPMWVAAGTDPIHPSTRQRYGSDAEAVVVDPSKGALFDHPALELRS